MNLVEMLPDETVTNSTAEQKRRAALYVCGRHTPDDAREILQALGLVPMPRRTRLPSDVHNNRPPSAKPNVPRVPHSSGASWHGTWSGWKRRRCGCRACVDASERARVKDREYKRRSRVTAA